MVMDKTARSYRVLFYLALLAGCAAVVLAWRVHVRYRNTLNIDPMARARQRDQQFTFTVDNYGYRYRGESGNVIDEYVLLFGAFEKDRLFFLRDYLASAGIERPVVIDVGANTGHHALFLSRHAAEVHAFEPFPPVIQRFRANLALNPTIDNIVLYEVGLGDEDAELPFLEPSPENQGQGSFRTEVRQSADSQMHQQYLRIVNGDNWLREKEIGNIAVIKIDVEGFEEAVLTGLQQTLVKHRPLVAIEVSLPPLGTIPSLQRLRQLLPDHYVFAVHGGSIEHALNGRYRLYPLDESWFKSNPQLEVIACPRESASLLPNSH